MKAWKMYFAPALLLPLVALGFTGSAEAYRLRGGVISSGAVTAHAPGQKQTASMGSAVNGTLGQAVVGSGQSPSWMACSGFWCMSETPVTAVDPNQGRDLPHAVSIGAAFPNPTRGLINFALALPSPARVRVEIYDLAGRKSEGAMEHGFNAGYHNLNIVASGRPAGVYFARLFVGGRLMGQRRFVLVQ